MGPPTRAAADDRERRNAARAVEKQEAEAQGRSLF